MKEPAAPSLLDPPDSDAPRPASPRPPRRSPRLLLLAAAWVIIIVGGWIGLHPLFNVEFPAQAANAGALLSFGLDALLLALCVVGSGALGAWILRLSRVVRLAGLERSLFGVGLGLGVNIGLMLGLGVLGGVNWPVAYTLLVVELALTVAYFYTSPGPARPNFAGLYQKGRGWWHEAGWWERGLALWCAGAVVATFLLTLTPPIAWDALMYHLEGPKQYIAAGRIQELPRLGQASFPFGAEMLFTWGLLLHGEGLAQAFSWLFGLLGALAIGAFAVRFFGRLGSPARARQAGWLAAALYLSIPHVWLLMTWAYTDTMLTFYALLAFYALLMALESEMGRVAAGYAVLAGVMAGLCWSGKYTAALAGVGALIGMWAVAGLTAPRPRLSRLLWISLVFGLATLLTFAPWLVRNIIFSGSPLAPIIGGMRGWTTDELMALAQQDGGVALTPDVILGRPFMMVLNGRAGGLYDATISPLFLALLPLSAWAARRNRIVAGTWAAIGLSYVGWLIGIRLSAGADHTRLILPVFPLLALVTAYGLLDLGRVLQRGPERLLIWTAKGAVGVFLGVSAFLLVLMFVANDPLPYAFGLQSRAERVEGQLGQYYRAARFVNTALPADAKVYMFLEPRAYYFDRPLSNDHNNGAQFFYYTTRYTTPQAFHDELVRRGGTHILVNETLLDFLVNVTSYHKVEQAQAGRQLLADSVAQGYLIPVYHEDGQYTVYKLR